LTHVICLHPPHRWERLYGQFSSISLKLQIKSIAPAQRFVNRTARRLTIKKESIVAANQVLHETTYDAAVARVFAAFADPDLRAKWGAPSERLAAALTGSRQCPLFAQSGHSIRARRFKSGRGLKYLACSAVRIL
jgi:hypothetical protein